MFREYTRSFIADEGLRNENLRNVAGRLDIPYDEGQPSQEDILQVLSVINASVDSFARHLGSVIGREMHRSGQFYLFCKGLNFGASHERGESGQNTHNPPQDSDRDIMLQGIPNEFVNLVLRVYVVCNGLSVYNPRVFIQFGNWDYTEIPDRLRTVARELGFVVKHNPGENK